MRRIAEGDGSGAQGDTGVFDGGLLPIQVPVTVSGIALCKVDAGYGSIRPGDLLTTSPTPGHAMLALDPLPGAILARRWSRSTREPGCSVCW